MTLALLEPRTRDRWALTFFLTESGGAEACPSFVCSWSEARELVVLIGQLQLVQLHESPPARVEAHR